MLSTLGFFQTQIYLITNIPNVAIEASCSTNYSSEHFSTKSSGKEIAFFKVTQFS